MHQLFFNLFTNSIKFSKPDQPNRIKVTCFVLSGEERNSIESLKGEGVYYKIVFEDEGIGFSKKSNEQIFTIFHRLNSRKDFEGHGIGLALCRKIVTNHHGVISADSEENKGSVFTIILPEKQSP